MHEYRCRYCGRVVEPVPGEFLPRDRCHGKLGGYRPVKGWHLWKPVKSKNRR